MLLILTQIYKRSMLQFCSKHVTIYIIFTMCLKAYGHFRRTVNFVGTQGQNDYNLITLMLFRAYQADYLATQGGKVGITLNVNWGEPQDSANPEHVEASERFMDFFLGWYAHPIFVSGQYPEVI